ncbi:M56 family metallopeptidase [Colwelliaceae bacterium MEBiC 14330]
MFEQLFNNPILYSLSLTLLHFLWQGLLVGLMLKSALFLIDKNKSQLRYALATLAMFSNAILAILTFIMVYPDKSSSINSTLSPIPLNNLVNELTQKNALFSYQELLPSILAYSLPYLSLLWLITLSVLAIKLMIEIRNVNNLPMHSTVPASPDLVLRFGQLAKQINLTKTPQLLISLKAEVPMAIGWLKPVVLLPASMVTGLNSAQLEMLILHELAHIRRHDYLVNFFQTLIELLFFFHPSVHWVGRQMRNEREYCTDDIAVQHCGDAIAYAHTLTDTASLCAKGHFHATSTMAMAASGGDLKARVLRLVDHHCAPANNSSKWLAAVSLLLALTLLSMNQLLTMPFAQQLNHQFPWQENNLSQSNLVKNTISTNKLAPIETNQLISPLQNDSIAQQLLQQRKTISDEPLINPVTTPAIEQFSQQVVIANIQAPISEAMNTQESPTKINNPVKTITTKTEFLSGNSVKISQRKQETVKNTESIVLPKKSQAIHAPKVAVNKRKLEREQNVIEPIEIASPAKMTEIVVAPTVPEAKKVSAELMNEKSLTDLSSQQALASIDALNNNTSPYQQLSYQNEINQLSENNKRYKSSYPRELDISPAKEIDLAPKKLVSQPSYLSAKLLNSVSPVYPSIAKRRGIEMEVKVNFTIDQNGKVKDINFAQQSKLIYFKSAIRSAIKKWRFSPAIKNNRKIESKMSKIFSFSLEA